MHIPYIKTLRILYMDTEDLITGGELDIKSKTYIIKVDPALSKESADYFFKRVSEILDLGVRWKGYNFKYVGLEKDKFNEGSGTPAKESYDILIVLLDRSTKHKLLELTDATLNDQPKVDGFGKAINFQTVEFSYTFYSTPRVIVIDETNWRTSHEALGIQKVYYEQYVIFHEIGHAIGRDHKPIPDDPTKPYPIMYQATLGLPDLKRFLPYPNESDEN